MITIKKIKVTVTTNKEELFGFEYPFYKGLNILSGENSSGKSSVLSSIYYCLGMEQLVGGYNADIFKDSLKSRFEYNGTENVVYQSYAELIIENKLGNVATLTRYIESSNSPTFIHVSVSGSEFPPKFLHKRGDTDNEEGFYKWLLDFLKIKLPVYTNEKGKTQKILYLQHVFAIALVEQTKGWSDFFAMIPNFTNIRSPKQKIIEYTIGLGNLENEFKRDILKELENKYKEDWASVLKGFNILANYSNVNIPILSEKYKAIFTSKLIKTLKLRRKENGKTLEIDDYVIKLEIELKKLQTANSIKPNSKNSPKILEQQAKLTAEINQLNNELKNIHQAVINENLKRYNYKQRIKQIEKELSILEYVKKIDAQFLRLNINQVENCPVCNSVLTKNGNLQLTNQEKISSSESILFYKSENSLYKSYLENSDKLMKRFDKTTLYYNNKIREKKYLLDSINKELVEDSRLPSRVNITKEIQLSYELEAIKKIQAEFQALQKSLEQIAIELVKLNKERKILKEYDSKDDEIIRTFKSKFLKLLDKFSYPSSVSKRVDINNKKLLPVVKEYDGSTQVIRSKASASDFIRALWSYYLALLIEGKNHVGLLILDEPGQHAMDPKDMKALVNLTSKMKDKQIILAISKYRKKDNIVDNEEIIKDLLTNLQEGQDYNINMIDDNGRGDKAVQPLR
jgi:hypothetical protein